MNGGGSGAAIGKPLRCRRGVCVLAVTFVVGACGRSEILLPPGVAGGNASGPGKGDASSVSGAGGGGGRSGCTAGTNCPDGGAGVDGARADAGMSQLGGADGGDGG